MNKSNSIAAVQEVKRELCPVTQKPSAAGLMSLLWGKVDLPSLNVNELEWIGGLTEEIAITTTQLSEVVEGIGCLVMDDDLMHGNGSLRTPTSMARLMFLISDRVATISQMAIITNDAQIALRQLGAKRHD